MCQWLFEHLSRIKNWRAFVLLILLNVACIAGFQWREGKLNGQMAPDASKRGYSVAQFQSFFTNIGEDGRRLFAITQLTLDVIYPFAYGLLIALLLVSLYQWPAMRRVVLLPLLTVIFDLLENLTEAYLALSFEKGIPPSLAKLASWFTVAKWSGVGVCVVAIVIGALLRKFF